MSRKREAARSNARVGAQLARAAADERAYKRELARAAVRDEPGPHCANCGAPIPWRREGARHGQRPLYCGPACKQQAYRDRQRTAPVTRGDRHA